MMNEIVISKPDDYYINFNTSCDIMESHSDISIKNYSINDTKCRGNVEHLSFSNNTMEVVFNELNFNTNYEQEYKLNYVTYEILYVVEGALTCGNSNDNKLCTIQTGDIKLIKNDSTARWQRFEHCNKWKSISICFNQDFVKQLYSQSSVLEEINFIDIDKQVDNIMFDILEPEIKIAFYQILTSSCLSSLCRTIYVQSKALEIISLLMQQKSFNNSYVKGKTRYTINKEDIGKIKKVRDLLVGNYVNPLSINELSSYVGLSTSKLKEGFKNYYGITIYGCLRAIRMHKAQEYLLQGDKSVIEVANLVGYSNPSHFSSAFKNVFGVNPSKIAHK